MTFDPKRLELYDYAHVVDNIVVGVSVWDEVQPYDPPAGVTFVKLPYTEDVDDDGNLIFRRYTAGIGWTYNPKATVHKFVDNRPDEEPTDGDD
jgi:hypothetical protein